MKERILDFTKEPKEDNIKHALIDAYYVILDMLSEEDENKVNADFKNYMEECKKQGKDYTPAYLWALQRIKTTYEN